MAMTINTNVASINAQRNLGLSGSSLSTSMQRLSSGLRVNSAKDDAAGLAISERMKAQSGGLTVAARNANDGISLAQTAEGALGKVGDMLQRVRELAVQSSNATNSKSDREALQAEVTQLVSEIDRVAKTTSFNGTKILDGSFAGGVFQVGANAGDNITVGGIANAKADQLASVKYYQSAGDVTDIAAAVGALPGPAADGYDTAFVKGDLKVNGVDLDAIAAASSGQERAGQVVAAINAKTADTGVTAFLDGDAIKLRSDNEDDAITLTGFEAAATGLDDTANSVANTAFEAAGAAGTLAAKGINSISVSTQADAWLALKKVDSAIDTVNSARADLGALQTRFEKSVENIDIQNENIKAASGRITDADFAVETANLSRAQILQQAGTAMVAQANQLPQGVLSLLR
ncbi:flagellin [Pantoea sp. 18069]|uniref:flagellin N-terminal helical domain-containing protein n=1 Tax=Pantoea sp. 18069 TaxID=2681415 RepID=UPI00135705D3|nr:flagellin [Pantoea sp. 18069]